MMIKLGNSYVNEDYIEAIIPKPTGKNPFSGDNSGGKGFFICLISGRAVATTSDEEVRSIFEAVGLLDSPCEAPPRSVRDLCLDLTFSELEDLQNAWDSGFRFVAKDANGMVFAFSGTPKKGESSWINDDTASRVKRLHGGPYEALSFEDVEPLVIQEVLEVVNKWGL